MAKDLGKQSYKHNDFPDKAMSQQYIDTQQENDRQEREVADDNSSLKEQIDKKD